MSLFAFQRQPVIISICNCPPFDFMCTGSEAEPLILYSFSDLTNSLAFGSLKMDDLACLIMLAKFSPSTSLNAVFFVFPTDMSNI